MRIGIVGSEGAKFTTATEALARQAIRDLITGTPCEAVVSGGCHLGGIDIWAVEEATKLGIPVVEYKPQHLRWEGGYKQRNLLIAFNSDHVVCFTIKTLPSTYTGMKFKLCYHCQTDEHVKSGGCWTVKQALRMGKTGAVVVLEEPDGL